MSPANTSALFVWWRNSIWWISFTWQRLWVKETCDRKACIFTYPLTPWNSWTPLWAAHVRAGAGVSPDGPAKKPKGVIQDLLMTRACRHLELAYMGHYLTLWRWLEECHGNVRSCRSCVRFATCNVTVLFLDLSFCLFCGTFRIGKNMLYYWLAFSLDVFFLEITL